MKGTAVLVVVTAFGDSLAPVSEHHTTLGTSHRVIGEGATLELDVAGVARVVHAVRQVTLVIHHIVAFCKSGNTGLLEKRSNQSTSETLQRPLR